MKSSSRVIVGLFLFTSTILLVRMLILFPGIIATTDTPGIYFLFSIAHLIFFCVTFFYLFKYIRDRDHAALTNMEFITAVLQFISALALLLFLSTKGGFGELFRVSLYLGYILLLLGGIAYYKSKRYICISFISWGVYILLWINSFIYGAYGVGG